VPDPRFEEVKEFVRSGVFGTYNYDELMGSLEGNEGYGRADYFLVGKDFPSYIECQEKVDKAYRDQKVRSLTVAVYFLDSLHMTIIQTYIQMIHTYCIILACPH
jgi:glucan phosphorylase